LTAIPFEAEELNECELEEECNSLSSEDNMDEDEDSKEDEDIESDGKIPDYVPEFFVDAYRRGQMPASFMDLFTFQIFIIQPQVCLFNVNTNNC